MEKITHSSWDIQYFEWSKLIKAELRWWVIVDYSVTPKRVYQKR